MEILQQQVDVRCVAGAIVRFENATRLGCDLVKTSGHVAYGELLSSRRQLHCVRLSAPRFFSLVAFM